MATDAYTAGRMSVASSARVTAVAPGTRAIVAAALSTIVFYAIWETLWGRAPAGGRNYGLQFLRWALVYAPGIIAIARPAGRR